MENSKKEGYGWSVTLTVLLVLLAGLQTSTTQTCSPCTCTSLTSVDCNNRGLTSFPQIPPDLQRNVSTLQLSNNLLTVLEPNALENYTSLQSLTLSRNQLTRLPEGLLHATTQLQELYITGNQLSNLPEGLLSATTQLQLLWLSENRLTKLRDDLLSATTQLVYLFLYGNQLTRLPEGLLNATTQLQYLHLHSNQLTSLPEGLLHATTQLQQLNLQDNQLTKLPEGLLNATTQLQHLSLYNNPLNCDCELSWLPAILRNVNEIVPATCATPANLTGRTISTLPENLFICTPVHLPTDPPLTSIATPTPVISTASTDGTGTATPTPVISIASTDGTESLQRHDEKSTITLHARRFNLCTATPTPVISPASTNGTAAAVPSSDLTIALSVLVPLSGLLVLAIFAYVPVVVFKRRRKVDALQDNGTTTELLTRGNPLQLPQPPPPHLPREFPQHYHPLPDHDASVISENSSVEMIQDYASAAIELTRSNPLQLPPLPPPPPPPCLPQQQYPPRQQYPPQLSTHDNTSVNDGPSLTHEEDLKHLGGSPSISADTGKPKSNSAAHPSSPHPTTRTDILSCPTIMTNTPSQHLHNTTSTDSSFDPANMTDPPSQSFHSTTRTDTPSHSTTTTDPPSQTSHPTTMTDTPSKLSPSVHVSQTRRGSIEGAKVADSTYERISQKPGHSPLAQASEAVGSGGATFTRSDKSKTPQLYSEDHYEQLGNVYDRMGTYENSKIPELTE